MGISRRAYAKRRGVTEGAVRKAIAAGRISVESDGTLDPDKADAHWNDGIIPQTADGYGHGGVRRKGKRAVPVEAVEAVQDALRSAGQDVPDEAGGMSFIQARTANEILKAQERDLKLKKLRGELIDRNRALAMVFGLARQERDTWINWPVRVAALFAAEIGADVHAVQNGLDKVVRAHLAEMAEIEIGL